MKRASSLGVLNVADKAASDHYQVRSRDPSVRDPSVREPSVVTLSVRDPSVRDPSVRDPCVREPSVREPSVGTLSVRDPSVRDPSVRDPSVRVSRPRVQKYLLFIFNPAGDGGHILLWKFIYILKYIQVTFIFSRNVFVELY
ncbi:hypothetical protein F2P81_003348 [Scophthalmus maximus]|uniref:Uncharacterized protein n=1 Tax=Scophthalmus maximus TaxID=52904 RepID=A0A6A4TKP4_SCOMX|nr:hypothetical protein F2P81_003348 [Scophthalmus maximus]